MSYWTPYLPEQPLDLTKKMATGYIQAETPSLRTPLPIASSCPPYLPPARPSCIATSLPSPQWSLGEDSDKYQSSSLSASPSWSTSFVSESSMDCVTSANVDELSSQTDQDPEYRMYRENMLAFMAAKNGGQQCISNPRMKRSMNRSITSANAEYIERRQKNNAAAKRSRDMRKMKEKELAIRVCFLEQKNKMLQEELRAVKARIR